MSIAKDMLCHITSAGDEELTEICSKDTEIGINEYINSFLKGDTLKGYSVNDSVNFNYFVSDEFISDNNFANAIRSLANANGKVETLRSAQLLKNIISIKLTDSATSLYEYHLDFNNKEEW